MTQEKGTHAEKRRARKGIDIPKLETISTPEPPVSLVPRKQGIAVAGLIEHPDGNRVLLSQRADKGYGALKWHIAGGKLEFGERSFHDRVKQELLEEICVRVEVLEEMPCWITNVIFEVPAPLHVVCLHFRCRIISGEPACGEDTIDVKYCTEARIKRLRDVGHMLPSSVEVLKKVLRWKL